MMVYKMDKYARILKTLSIGMKVKIRSDLCPAMYRKEGHKVSGVNKKQYKGKLFTISTIDSNHFWPIDLHDSHGNPTPYSWHPCEFEQPNNPIQKLKESMLR